MLGVFTRFGAHQHDTAFAKVETECLQMLHLPADLAYTHVKHCRGASTTAVSANAAPVSRFGAHSRETLFWRKNQRVSANAAPVSGFGVHPRKTMF